jgi:CheY-like chemotaxis protein
VPKILIADDNTNIQRMVALAFEERGIQVVAVGNGEAAVRRLVDLNPDIVLADIFMPVRSGYEVCEYIKKDQRFSHIPVILLIGAFDPLDEKEARRVGADGVLKKPFVPPDPLIAMVTSVLEKNPQFVAELAKAKEVIAEPVPLPEPVVAAKIDPKPLPHFPEPTPEEAALVYGFGSGRRSILEEEKDRDEPALPVDAEATEEEFQAAETSRDWRRNAMDFEVPVVEGGSPAFSDDAAFPSEHDVPALNVRAGDFEEVPKNNLENESQPVTADSGFDFASDRVSDPVNSPVNDSIDTPVIAMDVAATLQPETISESETTESAVPLFATADEIPAVDVPVTVPEPETVAAQSDVRIESEVANEPVFTAAGFASNVPHWMDALSAEPSRGGWMSDLTQSHEQAEVFQQAAAPLALRELPGALVAAPPQVSEEAPVEQAPSPQSQPANGKSSFFADDPANDSWFAPAPAAFDPSREAVAPAVAPAHPEDYDLAESAAVPSNPDRVMEAEAWRLPSSVSQRDPNLIEQTAVRVTPEPLLQADESEIPSWVTKRDPELIEQTAVRVTREPLLDAEDSPSAAGSESHGGWHVDSQFEEAFSAPSFAVPESVPSDAHSQSEPHEEFPSFSSEAFAEEFNERIPTGPPPNRQALADIPFLTPPPDFNDRSQDNAELSAEAMDAVVQRVVEKLAPQLQELLSQGVLKPLIENLLQGELAKRNR